MRKWNFWQQNPLEHSYGLTSKNST